MSTTTLMSFADFERLDPGAGKIELLKGELIRVPPAKNVHMDASERLFKALNAVVDRLQKERPNMGLGAVHIERGYRFSDDPPTWLQPDVSVTYPGQLRDESYYLGAPLIAFEVVSEHDKASDLNTKVEQYLANGGSEVWLIYPRERVAWIFVGSDAARKETATVRSPLLPGIEIPFSEIFQPY
jgi:Uma2 family endonuclease